MTNNKKIGTATIFIKWGQTPFIFHAFLLTLLIAILGCATQPQKLSERDAKIKKAVEQLKDKNEVVRACAALTLGRLQAKEYAKNIAGLLKDKNVSLRWAVMETLVQLDAKECTKDIAELLKDKDEVSRYYAKSALIKLDAKEYANDLAELLKDKNERTRYYAMWILMKWGAKGCTKDIAKLLEDKNAFVRYDAIFALQRLGAKECAKDIAKLLKDKEIVRYVYSPDMFKGGWWWDGQYEPLDKPTWTDFDHMGNYAVSPEYLYDETICLDALTALVALQAKECAKDIAELLKDEDDNTRGVAVLALGKLDAKEYADDIKPLLNDKNEDIRKVAKKVLKKWGIDFEKIKNEK